MMNRSFATNLAQPNQPLRKPSSSPLEVSTLSSGQRPLSKAGETPVRPAPGAIGDGPAQQPAIRDESGLSGSMPPALTIYFCNYCGQQGNFRCMRCKKTPYCSVVCQTEDWKAHRHVCKSIDPEPAKEKTKEITALPMSGDRVGQSELKHADTLTPQRVYLKDLPMTKIVAGTDFQASVIEFYSPGRFFILAQKPELLETLQKLSTELQKTYSCPSKTTYVPCVGEVCGVQFSCDLNWYRGLVQTLTADQKMANVLYIDYGNEEDVPVERIRPLTPNIPPTGPCAVECCIAGVVPNAGNWSGKCCIAVRQSLAGKTVTVKLVETLENSRIHAVDILLSMGQLSTFLVQNGYAAEEAVSAVPTQQEINAMMSASLENFKRHCNGKDDNTWAQPPEPLTQAVGDSFSVVVTHLQSPDEIIVQKVENAGVIRDLQLNLRKHCCEAPAPQNFRPAPGTVCCAQFSEDKQWYRAKVLAYPSDKCVCVGYLDFGNSEEVDLDHLQPISSSLLALPMQAVPCGLAGLQPIGEKWSEACLSALQRRVSNRILRIEIQGAQEGKVLVTMIDETSDPQGNVAELLISAGYAASAPAMNSSDQQVNQKEITAVELHVPDPACESLAWIFTEIPCDNQTVALLPCVVENPGEFYCRVDCPSDHQRLLQLETELKQHCETDDSPFEPKVGEPCCAMFPGDGAWYRAMVKELSEDQVSVNIVDYGHSMKVEKRHLRSIKPRFLTLPFQAVRCWLAGVEPLGSEWSSEALLWFQTLVEGKQLSARVVCVNEQGHGLDLDNRGQNVAAALISEQLAKVPGEVPKTTHATTGCGAKYQECAKENKHNQMLTQASNQIRASSEEVTTKGATLPLKGPSFPVDWKTVELPLNETFKLYIAAVSSPSLFYMFGSNQVNQQELQGLMMDVAAYCTDNQASSSSAVLSTLAPGSACCAQFSCDKNWHRAVVLEVGEEEVNVIYADYGNTEKVPFSQILPIPTHLLQLPFQISRCTLAGKEHFPAEWPKDVQQLFQAIILNGVLATVQSFDGYANVLSLTLPAEMGGGNLTDMIVNALKVQTKGNKDDQTASATAASDCPQPKSVPEIQKGLEQTATDQTITQEPTLQTTTQNKITPAESVVEGPVKKIIEQMEPPCKINTETNAPQTSGCCCLSLQAKVDRLEQLMQIQLSLINQLVGETK